MDAQLKLKTNLDTNLLKLIAIISMAVDHVGTVFFPEYPVFRWIGRLAFPIFCYCLTVGMLYTKDIKKYLLQISSSSERFRADFAALLDLGLQRR